jgi:AcrR family transcriptional regulator
MAQDVNRVQTPTGSGPGKRPRVRRAEQARATRRRIIDAASRLFLNRGYAATMLEQVAEDAGVAVQTVYFHFGNKRTLLKEALDIAAVGDDEPVPLLDRPLLDEIRNEPDPARMIELWVANGVAILKRIGPIMRVVRDAAGTDPDLAAQWATNQQQTLTAQRRLAQILADREALKPGMTVQEATDIIFTLNSIEVSWLLTTTCGWTVPHREAWITHTLRTALLR